MLSVILASSLFLGPADAAQAEAVQLVARVTEERFVAVNPSDRAQLLVFHDREGGRAARTIVAAGGEVAFDFPAGTLDSLLLHVVSPAERSATAAADYDLGSIAARGFQLFWTTREAANAHAWGVDPMNPDEPVYVPAVAEPSFQSQALAPHVPVITPTDKPKGDLPPRIDDKPLPPV